MDTSLAEGGTMEPGYGGFAAAAAMITNMMKCPSCESEDVEHDDTGIMLLCRNCSNTWPLISRQQVYVWYKRRSRNGFPERYDKGYRSRSGRVMWMFKLSEVAEWYVNYVPDQGGRPKRKAEENGTK